MAKRMRTTEYFWWVGRPVKASGHSFSLDRAKTQVETNLIGKRAPLYGEAGILKVGTKVGAWYYVDKRWVYDRSVKA